MFKNPSNSIRKSIKYILSIFITLSLLNCSPEDITDSDQTDAINVEGETNTDIEDPSINEPVTGDPSIDIPNPENPITEEPVVINPVIEDPTEEVIEENLTEAETLLILVNESRAEEGLSALTLNNALNKAALSHSTDMETNDYFSHEGLNGSRFWDRTEDAGYMGSPAGENIAVGQRDAEAVHTSWMNSEGHRNNILNSRITEMGLGNSGRYWTQIFGVAR